MGLNEKLRRPWEKRRRKKEKGDEEQKGRRDKREDGRDESGRHGSVIKIIMYN